MKTIACQIVRIVIGFLIGFVFAVPGYAVPPTPSALTSGPPTDGQANLYWQADSPAAGVSYYLISRQLQGTQTPAPTPVPVGTVLWSSIPSPSTPVFTDSQVTNGQVYLYQVVGIDGSPTPTPGAPAAVSVSVYFSPSAVYPVTVQAIHDRALDLSWGLPDTTFPVSVYQVFRYALPNLAPTPTGSPAIPISIMQSQASSVTTIGTNYFSDASADPAAAQAYYYYVMAVDSAGLTSALPPFSTNPGVPLSMGLPGPVTLNSSISTGSYGVSLFWNGALSSEQVGSYQVLRNYTPVATVTYAPGVPTITYLDNSVVESKSGIVYGIAVSNQNGTTNSNSVTQYLVPSTGGAVQVSPNASSVSVTISWNAATAGSFSVTGYNIYKGFWGPATTNPTPGATLTPSPTPFFNVVFNPTAGYTVTPIVDQLQDHMGYWVQPVDAAGQGGIIGISATPYLLLAPTPPAGLQASIATPGGNNTFQLTWTQGGAGFFGNPDHYALYRSVLVTPTATPTGIYSPTPTQAPVATVPWGMGSVTDVVSGYPQGTTVIYSIALFDGLGNPSDLVLSSTAVTLYGLTNAPAAPTILPFSGGVTGIQYSWLLNPGADSVTAYQIYGNGWTPGSSFTPVATSVNPSSTPTFAPIPSPGIPNVYYLVAQNSVSTSAPATLSGIPLASYAVTAVVPVGTQAVSVTWNLPPSPSATPNIDSYGIYRSLGPGAGFTPVATVVYPTMAYQDVPPVATAGVTYYYFVTARSGPLAESPSSPTLGQGVPATVQIWPNVVSGITVQANVNQTTLGWSPNAVSENVTTYMVYRNGTPTMTVTPGTPYSLNFAESPGNLSVYQVSAQNAAGFGNLSQPISVLVPPAMTPVIALTPPPSVTTTPIPAVWISGLSYGGNINGFNIYRQVTATNTPALIANVTSGTTFYQDPNPIPGFINQYQVVANNGLGLQTNPSISASLGVTLWPAVPVFTVTGSSQGLTLSCNGSTGDAPVTVFNIYRNLYPTMTPPATPTPLSSGSTFIDPAVTPGVAYVYWMGAQNASGNSGLGSPQTAMALDPPSLYVTPLPEKNLLVWTVLTPPPGSPVTGYSVYRAVLSPTPQFSVLANLVEPLNNTSYPDSVSDGVTYLYKVAGTSANGILGAFSNVVAQYVSLQPVSQFTAVSGDRLVQLRWNYQGVNTITYTLQRKLGTDSDSNFQTLKSGLTGNSYIDAGVVNKDFYVYRLYSVDEAGNSASAIALALPAKAPLVGDVAVTLTQNNNNLQTLIGNTLNWQGADQANFDTTSMYPLGGYTLSRSTDGGGVYEVLATLPVTFVKGIPAASVTYFDQVPLVNGNTNTYLVQAFDAPPDLPVPLSQAATQGLVHTTTYNPVTAHAITPNTALDRNALRPFGAPNEQVVNIRFVVSDPGHVNIKVYNLAGTYITELVNNDYSPGIFWTSWDAHNRFGSLVASGVYLITTESPGHQEFSKIAVIK